MVNLKYMTIKDYIQAFGTIFIILGVSAFLFTLVPVLFAEAKYHYNVYRGIEYHLNDSTVHSGETIDNSGITENNNTIVVLEPINKDFSIVIEKIGVNAPVIPNVNVSNKKSYLDALRRGVAHADGTVAPGSVGNMTLFAHSALDFWDMGKYAKVFNLLKKVSLGDKIVIYYQGRTYVYEVFSKEIVKGWDTEPLTEQYKTPVITLITCDPPGTAWNRLVVKGIRIN